MREINIALIGQGFMGRTHSNAWNQVTKFFPVPAKPVLKVTAGQPEEHPEQFQARWGWQTVSTDWEKTVADPGIDLVDIVTPNNMHAPMAMAAIAAGKAVACEKPIASTLDGARGMAEAARKAGVKSFVWYNYRRVPAVSLAHRLVKEGAVGEIRHVRAHYLQDWADDNTPLLWRFLKEHAGTGAHGDLNAHIVDMTRFVTGLEITTIDGAIAETFVKERTIPVSGSSGGIAAGASGGAAKGKVTVDDTLLFLAHYNNGAVGSYEAARQATGNQNRNGFEINGTKGSLRFNFERMNELEFYDATRPRAVQGWTNIICTHGGDHPYAEYWWPDAHLIGYEHGFTNQAFDILCVLAGKEPTVPIPDFEDAYMTQRVLEAALVCATEHRPVKLDEVK